MDRIAGIFNIFKVIIFHREGSIIILMSDFNSALGCVELSSGLLLFRYYIESDVSIAQIYVV